ncbi:MAG: hypothetical protein IPO92_18080 [Saprospiraceae bacterium]|nr:hypothetical protein [Saprospiraceae bacterium]
MKILNLTILLFYSIMAFSQDSRPAIKMPIKKNSNEYFSTFYSQDKTYTCEEWFSTYAQYYQSNYSTDLRLIKPTEKYALIKGNTQKDSIATFIFDVRTVEILSDQTPQNDFEEFISGTKTVDQMSRYFIEEKLLITGLLFPHNFNRNTPIYLSANGRGLGSQVSNDIIDFIEGYNTSNQLVFRLDSTVTAYQINPLQLQSLNIIVKLKTGFVYRYKYKHELCELDPISYPDPIGPPQGPNPNDPTQHNDPPHDVVVDNDCLIEPSYYNNPVTGNPYKATIPFNDLNPTSYLYFYNLIGSYTVNGVTTEIWGWEPVEIPNPYTSSVNQAVHGTYGEISTAVYLNPNHSTVKKPIIILDGIDFQSNRFLPDITRIFGGNNTISTLWDGGFDVIFVDFAGGADFMQRNSFALAEFIRSLRVDQK